MQESIEQIDPTEELTIETVKKRAVRGAAILTGRNVLIQGISFFCNSSANGFFWRLQNLESSL